MKERSTKWMHMIHNSKVEGIVPHHIFGQSIGPMGGKPANGTQRCTKKDPVRRTIKATL